SAGVNRAKASISSGVPPKPARSRRCAAKSSFQSDAATGVRSFRQAAGPLLWARAAIGTAARTVNATNTARNHFGLRRISNSLVRLDTGSILVPGSGAQQDKE